MKGVSSLENLIDDIEENIQNIFLIGINTADNRNIEELTALSGVSKEFGLDFAAENLQLLAEELGKLKRNFEWDKSISVKTICRLIEYIELVKAQLFQSSEEE
ncbi:MAG: hypothetical protein Q8936_17900 [Bacillota bacterium]|nr:hypothetical protein [Bacillota bacterium]